MNAPAPLPDSPDIFAVQTYQVADKVFVARSQVIPGSLLPGPTTFSVGEHIMLNVVDNHGRQSQQPHAYELILDGATDIHGAVALFTPELRQQGAMAEIAKLKASQLGKLAPSDAARFSSRN